jgi:hypothetical protein
MPTFDRWELVRDMYRRSRLVIERSSSGLVSPESGCKHRFTLLRWRTVPAGRSDFETAADLATRNGPLR